MVRWWRGRAWRPDAAVVVLVVALAAQMTGVAMARGTRTLNYGIGLGDSFVELARTVGRTFGVASGSPPLVALGVVGGAALVAVVAQAVRTEVRTPSAVVGTMATVVAVGIGMWILECLLDGAHDRYAIVPMLCLTWLVLAATDRCAGARDGDVGPARPILVGAVVGLLAMAWSASWPPNAYRSATPSWRDEIAKATTACADGRAIVDVLISPRMVPPDQWYLEMPCERLGVVR
jgi:hypothetical protein